MSRDFNVNLERVGSILKLRTRRRIMPSFSVFITYANLSDVYGLDAYKFITSVSSMESPAF